MLFRYIIVGGASRATCFQRPVEPRVVCVCVTLFFLIIFFVKRRAVFLYFLRRLGRGRKIFFSLCLEARVGRKPCVGYFSHGLSCFFLLLLCFNQIILRFLHFRDSPNHNIL